MTISGIVVDGQVQVVPGAFSEVREARAVAPAVIEAGVPCLIGEGVGAQPQVVHEFSSLAELRDFIPSGDIREAAEIVFDAVDDPQLNGKPTKILVVITNPNTQSLLDLNSAAGPALRLTSVGYGAFTERISANIVQGTNKGIALTIEFDGVVDASGDDIGGDDIFSLTYVGVAATMTATLDATGVFAEQTFTQAGLDDEIITGFLAGESPRVSSASAYDDYQVLTVYGLDNLGVPISEAMTLNGTTDVDGSVVFEKVTAVKIDGLYAGTITVSDQNGVPNVFATLAATLTAAPAVGTLSIESASALDVGQSVTFVGRNALGTALQETVVLNGLTPVVTNASFTKLQRVTIVGTTVGTATVKDSGAATVLTLSAGVDSAAGLFLEAGIRFPIDLSFDGKLTLVSDGASTKEVVVRGVNSSGLQVAEKVDLTGVTPVLTSNDWKTIDHIELGLIENAQTLTFTSRAWTAAASQFDTFTKLEAFVSGKAGFTLVLLATDIFDRVVVESDFIAAVNVKSVTAGFTADLDTTKRFIEANSRLTTPTRLAGGTGQLLSLLAPQFLIGGSDAVSTVQNFSDALDLLKGVELDYAWVGSSNATVHALAKSHADFMAGAEGRSERFMFVGSPVGTTKTSLKALTAALNSEYVRFAFQEIERLDSTLTQVFLEPIFAAALEMGAQASGARGRSTTFKTANVISFRQDASFVLPRDEAELIRSGVSLLSVHPEKNTIWKRSITTYQVRADDFRQEAVAVDSRMASLKNARQLMEVAFVGQEDVDATPSVANKQLETILSDQKAQKVINDFRNVNTQDLGTGLIIEYDLQPVRSVNFVLLRTFAGEIPQAA